MIDVVKFKKWLTDRGAEILPPTNEYEAIRFKGREIGVLYKSGKVSNKYTNHTIIAFVKGKKWFGAPKNVGRNKNYGKQKRQIMDRDGRACFYCGKLMTLSTITLEHLIPLSMGGKNELSNMVLAHEKCNKEVGNMPIYKKVDLAIKKRIENIKN
jgi:5-methylcytosine-specific restriction endonuclease McrA